MKKLTKQLIVVATAALACTSSFSQSLSFSKQSWSTGEGEPFFYVQPDSFSLTMGNCTFSRPDILSVSTTVLPSANLAMIVINEENARKLPLGNTSVNIRCGTTWNKDFVVKNTGASSNAASVAMQTEMGLDGMVAKIIRPATEVINPNVQVNFWVAVQINGEKYFLTGQRGASGFWVRTEDESDEKLKHLIFSTQSAASATHNLRIDFAVDGAKKQKSYTPQAAEMPIMGADPSALQADAVFYSKQERPQGNIEKILIGYQVGFGEVQIAQQNPTNNANPLPSSTYNNADERHAFDLINKIRQLHGFGYVYQHEILDKSATAHAKYLSLNYSKTNQAHMEDPALPGFTGVLPRDRAKHFGYTGSNISESVDGNVHTNLSVFGLLGVPYHALGLLNNQKFVGVGTEKNEAFVYVTDTGASNAAFDKDEVFVYPCNNIQVNIQSQGYETPNPRPLNGKRDFGYSSVAIARLGIGFRVNSWELFDANGKQVKTVLMDQEPISDFASLIPWDTLPRTETNYTSILKGTIKGVPFEKTCKWRTIAGNNFPMN